MSPESQNALSDAQRILQDDYPEVDAIRLSRVEARIRSEIEDSKKAWWLPVSLAAAAAVGVAVFAVNTTQTPQGDFNQNGVIAWDSSSPKQTDLGATLTEQPAQLEQGELRFEVKRLAEMKPFVLQTPHVDVTAQQAQFSIVVDSEATQLAVEAGRVDVRTAADQPWRAAASKEVFRKSAKTARTTKPVATTAVATAEIATPPKTEPSRNRPEAKVVREPLKDITPDIPAPRPPKRAPPVVPVAQPKPPVPTADVVSNWMSEADIARRQGNLAAARALYKKVAEARNDAGLKEEATLRWAQTAARTGHRQEALAALAGYNQTGALLPERIALQASLHLKNGDGRKGARLITLRAPRPLALVVAEVAVAIAEAEDDASKVVDLCLLVRASASSTPSLKERARVVELKPKKKEMIDR